MPEPCRVECSSSLCGFLQSNAFSSHLATQVPSTLSLHPFLSASHQFSHHTKECAELSLCNDWYRNCLYTWNILQAARTMHTRCCIWRHSPTLSSGKLYSYWCRSYVVTTAGIHITHVPWPCGPLWAAAHCSQSRYMSQFLCTTLNENIWSTLNFELFWLAVVRI